MWAPGLGPEFGADFQAPFFTGWLNWTGIDDVTEIRFHPTLTGDVDEAGRIAHESARDTAKTF